MQIFYEPSGKVEVAVCNLENRVTVNTGIAVVHTSHFAPGDVVIATFQDGSKTKRYVGQVLAVELRDLHVKFLRSRGEKVFYFPAEDDIAWHSREACTLCVEQPIFNIPPLG
jgi:hypothetical protein